MANQSKYTPEELANRIDEILSGTGEPYQPGADPLVDAAMRLRNTVHPIVSEETIAAIGAGLIMANNAAAEPPSLSNDAFNEIAAKLQAQAQLQAAPKPLMNDEAFNRIATQLQLRNAPKPAMNDATLLRIEQQLVQAARPGAGTGYLTIVAMLVIAVVGGLLALTVMLNYDSMEVVPSAEVLAPSATPQVDEPAYTTTINVEVLPSVVVEVEDEQLPTEIVVPTVEPTSVPEIVFDEPETLPSAGDIIQLPSAIMTEGIIEAMDDETLTVYGMTFTFAHNPSVADGYAVGDTIHIEGTVNPLNPDIYVIAAIEPVIDPPDERPVLVSIGVEPDADDETPDDDTDTSVTVTTTDTTISGSTGTTTTDAPTDECGDGEDSNQGRGQECNRGRGSSQSQDSSGQGRGRP